MNTTLNINHLPTKTWNWLKINSTEVQWNVSNLQSANKSVKNIPQGVTLQEDVNDKSYLNVETCCGSDVTNFLSDNNVKTHLLTIQKNVKLAEPVVINFSLLDKSQNADSFVIKAEENSSATVIMIFESEPLASGSQVIRTICHAEQNANIHFVRVQLLGNGFNQIDDVGTLSKDESSIKFTHIILGGAKTYTGASSTLNSYKASFVANAAYYSRDEQELDLNYVVRCIAKKVFCDMVVKGTLKDKAKKTYRGSIEFRSGCKGAEGEETEDVLVLSKDAVNKSVPLILCDEEDIAGEHASTIGRLGADVLFYMQSRGLSKENAEKIMARAKIKSVASNIEHEDTLQKIDTFIERIFQND